MKAIIKGKRYDTETATEIASDGYGYSGDFRYWHETLYKTKSGAWFTAGKGGPMSRYARSTGQNSWSGGSAIVPMSAEEAREWLETAKEVDAIEEHFPVQDA